MKTNLGGLGVGDCCEDGCSQLGDRERKKYLEILKAVYWPLFLLCKKPTSFEK